MTDTKPTLEEQIASQVHLIKNHSGHGFEIDYAILASLERLKSLDAQPVPVEPDNLRYIRDEVAEGYKSWLKPTVEYIDSLLSALQVAQQERDAVNLGYNAMVPTLRERAEKAESSNKRLVELLKDPSQETVKNCARRLLRFQDNSTDESFSKLQWAEVKQDAERVIAELYAELLREVGK